MTNDYLQGRRDLMYPLFLHLEGRLCVVIGGGAVGLRKTKALLDAGACVRVVCREQRPPEETSPFLEWLHEPYKLAHLDGAVLVFAAAVPEINHRVVADARARGIWVNSATEPEMGDFLVPAVVRRGDFVLAVSTHGAAPALAQEVRRRLENYFDDSFGRWVAILAELRTVVLTTVADPDQRHALFERFCSWDWLELLRHEGSESVRAAMLAEVKVISH